MEGSSVLEDKLLFHYEKHFSENNQTQTLLGNF